MSAPPHADPGRGVFETMLVIAGRPVELDAHVARLNASVTALYGTGLPERARAAVLQRAGRVQHGKLRVTAIPSVVEEKLSLRIEAEELERAAVFPTAERSVSLRSFVVAGGLGCHKWADRRWLEQAESTLAERQLPLLRDADGSVLEASRGSVFVAEANRIVTPPTDGRILPSIARQQAIEAARNAGFEVRERALTADDLRRGEVFLTGSVRGVELVDSIDDAALPPPGPVSERVAAGLRRRWRVARPGESAAAAAGGRPAGLPVR